MQAEEWEEGPSRQRRARERLGREQLVVADAQRARGKGALAVLAGGEGTVKASSEVLPLGVCPLS